MQINPKTDYELALLLTRFAYMQDLEDRDFIDEFGNGADWFLIYRKIDQLYLMKQQREFH